MISRDAIRASYEAACLAEVDALKPGNVHRFADGHRMTVEEFLTSARVSSPALTDPALSTGGRVLAAVRATRQAVGTNTNLGIILLCAPLARAAEIEALSLEDALPRVLREMDIEDSKAVFQAIVLAAPGGLGSSESHDVREEPRVTIVEAMREAAGRDMIARQYASDYHDVFRTGLEAFEQATARGERGMWTTVFVYMAFLSAFPDSHLARKHGLEAAERVRDEAVAVLAETAGMNDETARIATLIAFDSRLKAAGLNPGTSADLTVASLFAQGLRSTLHNRGINGSIPRRN